MLRNRRIPLIYFLLTAAAFIAFWQLNRCDFINYDDATYVNENIHIQHGITMEAIRWAFTTGYASNWHPLTWMSHMLDVQLFGLNPRWHHLTNLLFHIANTLLLFFVFHRMTNAPWKSAFVAALFALHPLHVESVAWVAERKDVLSTFFWMLTMAAYISYVAHPRLKSYLAVLIFFALGLMAKPTLVTLPFALLLLDYWPLGRLDESKRIASQGVAPSSVPSPQSSVLLSLLLEKLPHFVLAALSCIVTYIAQQKGGSITSNDVLPLGVRIANALVSYVIYIEKTVWPHGLAIFYPHPWSLPLWQVFGAALLLIALTSVTIWKAKTYPFLPFGWLWFGGTLVPVIGIVQVGSQAMADRYTYIPLIGLFVMAAWGVPQLLQKWRYRKEALYVSSLLVLISVFMVTWTQTGYWRDSITLFDHALKVTTNNYIAHINRGVVYTKLGNYEQAIADFDKTVEINPQMAEAYFNRGVCYSKLGSHEQAIADFDKALEINPKYARAFHDRGLAYSRLGNQRKAIVDFNMAIEINPEFAESYYDRGFAYSQLGDHLKAIENYNRAVEIDPKYADAFNNLGITYAMLGNQSRAIENYSRAIDVNPDFVKAYLNRGLAFAALGKEGPAVEDLKTAARFHSEDAEKLLTNLGIKWSE
ncbi:MAG: tetratricopeptide repeat protein [Syntrophobacteraceae bacterium]